MERDGAGREPPFAAVGDVTSWRPGHHDPRPDPPRGNDDRNLIVVARHAIRSGRHADIDEHDDVEIVPLP